MGSLGLADVESKELSFAYKAADDSIATSTASSTDALPTTAADAPERDGLGDIVGVTAAAQDGDTAPEPE